ncbi:hypothetical protein [Halobacterium yunchengense]|uniref:hypothetical protein n=1 Tax=Halobacterium yunchengense TaxID=3108497 RepID=UPI00300A413B
MRVRDWQPTGCGTTLAAPVDARAAGVATQVTVPAATGTLHARDGDGVTSLEGRFRRTLEDGSYRLEVDAALDVLVAFDGPAVVEVTDRVAVRFDDPTPVALGARRSPSGPTETVTVPETPDGVATAVTHAAAAHRTTAPDRSAARFRRHPPRFAFADRVDVPDPVAAATPETGIEVAVPRSLRALFVAAPLAYYLGAAVAVEDGATPRLRAPDAGVDYALDELERDAPATLARAFWLDCLVREASSPHAPPPQAARASADGPLVERDVLADLGVDPDAAYDATPAERLATYLEAPFERVADRLPEWHLSMHVAPTLEHVRALPFLLDRLAFVFPPETAALERRELLERSLDDFYRGPPGPVATVEMLKPRSRQGRWQGWLAEGTPIDVFKTRPEAYRNHLEYRRRDRTDLSVAVVLNDRSMSGEHEAVADVYERRADSLPMAVDFYEDLTRAELADVLGDHYEFLHYIGHCEVEGLRCADGNLAVASLEETNVETFFLNACGSYYEGLDLVERGSVAGAVTLRKVLDEQAAKVGTAFARLLVHGFPIETALRLARRRIRMGKDYAVVGDGTQTLSRTSGDAATVAHVERADGGCEVRYERLSVDDHGCAYAPPVDAVEGPRLCGNPAEFELPADALAGVLEDADHPVIVDGEFYWSDEAAALLADARPTAK